MVRIMKIFNYLQKFNSKINIFRLIIFILFFLLTSITLIYSNFFNQKKLFITYLFMIGVLLLILVIFDKKEYKLGKYTFKPNLFIFLWLYVILIYFYLSIRKYLGI